jgi:hypothetical protein
VFAFGWPNGPRFPDFGLAATASIKLIALASKVNFDCALARYRKFGVGFPCV